MSPPTGRRPSVDTALSPEQAVRGAAVPLTGDARDHDALVELARGCRFVLLGEPTHGTHEVYEERARITRRLIEEEGFHAVAWEADWPDAWRAACWARGLDADGSVLDALSGFQRFPTWMWRNTSVAGFLGWLRSHNEATGSDVGVWGLDLYSLHRSMDAVVSYLDGIDAAAADRARNRYSCFGFDLGGGDGEGGSSDDSGQAYGFQVAFGAGEACERAVIEQLVELCRSAPADRDVDGRLADDAAFVAEQNARIAVDAERYYRTMYQGRVSSWNLRDTHMVETLESLAAHLSAQRGEPARIVVWAHNSHLGDARATEMGRAGEHDVGQLVRERYGDEALLVGFTTSTGTVTAADDWGGPAKRKQVREPLPESHEAVLQATGLDAFTVVLRGGGDAADALRPHRLERAIGVIYRPETERVSHWFDASMADQFDVVVHIDRTRAVEPLDSSSTADPGEAPDTFPHGT